ncbi:MAG: hypothetical protein ACI3VZ_06870 [Faecousia sp.]
MKAEQILIDDYAAALLADRNFRNIEYRKFVDNCYILQNIDGDIDPGILNAVIRKAKRNRKMRLMLGGILWYVNKDSITDENFRMLLSFPRRERDTYLAAISHAELAFYQVQMIYRVSCPFEAFAWLFDRICENDFFQEEDMMQILRENSDITGAGIRACINNAVEKYGDSPKLDIAKNWVDNWNKGKE